MLCLIEVSKKHDGPTGQILLSTVAGRGEDTKQTHNNQPNKQLDAYLGRVSLKCRGDRAAVALAAAHALRGHFVCVFTWLIVVHDVIFCYIYRNQLKPSHVTRNGIGQPPACAYLVSTPCSSGDGGPPWWRGPGHHTPKQKMGLSKKIKISNTEFDVQMERRFVIFSATKDQSKSHVKMNQLFLNLLLHALCRLTV